MFIKNHNGYIKIVSHEVDHTIPFRTHPTSIEESQDKTRHSIRKGYLTSSVLHTQSSHAKIFNIYENTPKEKLEHT